MNTSYLNVGIIHSLIGKNDGVSIVIDQTVNAMTDYMEIDLGNIFFLAANTSPRFNAITDEIFWHKNELHKLILDHYSSEAPEYLDELIHTKALYAKKIIKEFIESNKIDLIIAHNTTHPNNFITAVGLGYYIEELRESGYIWPKLLVWWHDSYFERERFKNPNSVIAKYLKYLPGSYIDGLAFLNSQQPKYAKQFLEQAGFQNIEKFLSERTIVVPNTCEIPWNWKLADWNSDKLIYPDQDSYNENFLRDVGLLEEVQKHGFSIDETVILLQHTRVVPRKNIELAIDFAFELEQRFTKDNKKRCIAILVSGHSGDEQVDYKNYLKEYYAEQCKKFPNSSVVFIFGENSILSHRDIIVDKKFCRFKDIPSIVAAYGGIGTYFSEVEGYGNNLLEMMSMGLPVVINKYDIYRTDIEHLGFELPSIENKKLTNNIIEQAYTLLTNYTERNRVIEHNLQVLEDNLHHRVMANKLNPLIERMFTKIVQ